MPIKVQLKRPKRKKKKKEEKSAFINMRAVKCICVGEY